MKAPDKRQPSKQEESRTRGEEAAEAGWSSCGVHVSLSTPGRTPHINASEASPEMNASVNEPLFTRVLLTLGSDIHQIKRKC